MFQKIIIQILTATPNFCDRKPTEAGSALLVGWCEF
jgi:hypothetical protein